MATWVLGCFCVEAHRSQWYAYQITKLFADKDVRHGTQK